MNAIVTMGPQDTNHKGRYWYNTYRTMGDVQFEELRVARSEVRKGDLMHGEIEYNGWAHVSQVSTSELRNPRTGRVSPARTGIGFGGMSWTSQLADEIVTVRRRVQ